MKPIYEEPFLVRTWDADAALRLTASAAFNYCQEAAGGHAEMLGVGLEAMREKGIAWILARMSLVLGRRPVRGETVRVRTWPLGSQRMFVRRDYELSDESGAVVGRGRSAWLIVDADTGRPRRPEALIEGIPRNEGMEALPDGAPPLKEDAAASPLGRRVAAYSDLDYNGHVNNARYVQWMLDALDAAELAAADGFRLDVNYLSESKQGDCVALFGTAVRDAAGTLHRLAARRESDGESVYRAELRLGPTSP